METLQLTKVESWLPVFCGFYESIFSPDEDMEIEHINDERERKGLSELEFDVMKFNYDDYHEQIAKECCQFIENELSDYVSKVNYQQVHSPAYYNFETDAIYVEYELTDENLENIKRFIFQNTSDFAEYVKSRYTSRPGFIPHYSNDPVEWLTFIDSNLRHKHKLGSILEFIARMTWDDPILEMYYACETSVIVSNYEDCTEREYCTECKEFVEPSDFLGSCCKECFEIGVHDYTVVACACCKSKIENRWAERQYLYKLKHGFITPYDVKCDNCI